MTKHNENENPKLLTDVERKEIKRIIIESFDEGMVEMLENHVRRLAEEEIYNQLGIGYAMGLWDSAGMGDDYLYTKVIRRRIAKKIGTHPRNAFEQLDRLVEARIAEIEPTYDGGKFRIALETMEPAAIQKIETAKTSYAASILKHSCHDFIRRCTDAHPEDLAPSAKPEIAGMSWIGVGDERPPFFGNKAEPEVDHSSVANVDYDLEIPF